MDFIPYILRNTVAVLYPAALKPAVVPAKPHSTGLQRLAVGFEIAAIGLLNVAVFYLVGGTWLRFVFASTPPSGGPGQAPQVMNRGRRWY